MDEATDIDTLPEQLTLQRFRVRRVFRRSRCASMSATCGSTPWSTRPLPTSDSASRLWPARCATFSRSAGSRPFAPTITENPKRIYYLSMEFLIGRSLANNVTNLLLRSVHRPRHARGEPRLGRPGRAGARCRPGQRRPRPAGRLLSRLDGDAAASRRWATACATSTACSARRSRTAGRSSIRTTGCAGRPVGGARAAARPSRSGSAAPSRCKRDACTVVANRALDPDRASPMTGRSSAMAARRSTRCGSGAPRRTITSTSWSSAAATSSTPWSEQIAAEDADARPLPGRLHRHGAGAALCPGVLPGRLLAGRHRAPFPPRQ